MKIPITGIQRLKAVTTGTPAFSWRTAAVVALSCVVGLGTGQAFAATHQVTHVFTIDDLVGGFDGRTYGTEGNYSDPDILCGIAGSRACPAGVSTMTDKQGNTLYPIDAEFGFYVTDFAGAIPKTQDHDYMEGFAGTIFENGVPVGISLANVATDTFRTQSGFGTWCAGLGNTSVKCSAEQYVVMEHVKSCYETIPYIFGDPERANPLTGAQPVLDYDGTDVFCDDHQLDNTLITVGDVIDYEGAFGPVGAVLTPEGTTIASDQILYDGVDGWLLPNESTVLENIAASSDYTVTGKDDGKPLYRWGDLHKRPNDIRMYARMALPASWKDPAVMAANGGMGIRVESALLSVDHVVTNNPNDQLRPEDMENEGAIGRKPGYVDLNGVGLVSDRDCYEADSDFIPIGSVYQNDNYPFGGLTQPPDPYIWSSDLKGGWTNGWYTTVDREPFEWSFDSAANGLDGSPDYGNADGVPDNPADELISGPRWRMTAQKFGQTVPGLEIPIIECSEPPYQKDNIKYDVGADYTTVINLLDWNPKDERSVVVPAGYADAGAKVSPLEFTNGWVEEAANGGAVVNEDVAVLNADLDHISINGAPITDDFDLSVYVKGDKKPTKVFDATLMVTYEDYVPPVDVSALSLAAPALVALNDPITVTFTVDNPLATDVANTVIEICGTGSVPACDTMTVTLPAASQSVWPMVFTAPAAPTTIDWTATVTAPGDPVAANNVATASTEVAAAPAAIDLVAVSLTAPASVSRQVASFTVSFTVNNPGAPVTAAVELCGVGTKGYAACFSSSESVASGDNVFDWDVAPPYALQTINWTATVTSATDPNAANDSQTASTAITRW